MNILGPDSLTFGVDDVAACAQYFTDFGLTPAGVTEKGGRFEAVDGTSVIIGGLLSEERTTNITKVPILGQIPGLGVLFQHRSATTTKHDLVIEVTPHILPQQP